MLQLNPIGGAIAGLPGSTPGWGFTWTNDSDYLVVTSADFTPATALGIFTDFISFAFIIVGPAPESTVVTQAFDAVGGTGIGSFQIDPLAAAGAVALGQIEMSNGVGNGSGQRNTRTGEFLPCGAVIDAVPARPHLPPKRNVNPAIKVIGYPGVPCIPAAAAPPR